MKKGLLFFSCLFLICIGLRWNSAPFFCVKKYRCAQTGSIAQDYFLSVQARAEKLVRDNYSADALINHVKKTFPVINKIIVAYRPFATCVMTYPHTPICCINNSLILTSSCQFFSKDIFEADAIAHIPAISVLEENFSDYSLQLLTLLDALPPHFGDIYDLKLINDHCIHLIDKKNPHFIIVSFLEKKNLSSLLHQCDMVKNKLIQRNDFTTQMQWAIDTRFADYIVAYKV
jgi:hypothetical protein